MVNKAPKSITAWSASRLAAWEKCPFAFAQENVYGNKAPKGPAAQRGIDIHADLEAVARGTMELEQVRHNPKRIMDFAPTMAEIRANAPMLEEKWAFTKNMGRASSYFAPDVWYRSILDVGIWWADNSFTALDWKTGKPYGSNAEQMEQQAMSIFARLPQVNEVETVLAYVDSGDTERAEYQRSQYKALKEKWFARVAPLFNDKIYAPRPGRHCTYCHFRRSNGGPCSFG